MGDLFESGRQFSHDPGGRTRLRLQPGIRSVAEFSPCGKYRYWLSRDWCAQLSMVVPYILWIGMNPSTADTKFDDPTVRKEVNITKRDGYSRMIKANVCDYRATNPKTLLMPGVDPCSDQNLRIISEFAHGADKIVLAYGRLPKPLLCYVNIVLSVLPDRVLWCLGKTKDGSPRHPLYVPLSTQLEVWSLQ